MSKSIATQITLWNEVPRVPTSLTAVSLVPHRNKLNELTGESIRILPISAGKDKTTGKLKDSLKQRNPDLKPKELKELAKAQGLEMKSYLGQVSVALIQNPDVIGLGARVAKNGRVSLVFKKDIPQVDMLTDEDLAAAMGRDVAWVRKNRKTAPVEIQVDLQGKAAPESQPKPKAGKVITAPVSTPEPAAA